MTERELPPPLEIRIEDRAKKIGKMTKDIAGNLQREGLSEEAIASLLAIHEDLNETVECISLTGEDKTRLITELKKALFTLTHGIIMGDSTARKNEQLTISQGRGALAAEIKVALEKVNGTGESGGIETSLSSETEV